MLLKNQFKMMGTLIDVQIQSPQAQDLMLKVQQQLEEFNHIFSANDEKSILSILNQTAGLKSIEVPEMLYQLIEIGKKESLAQPSNLNIAIGPLVKTWNIGFSQACLPSPNQIQEALALTDPAQIHLQADHHVYLAQKGMKIDLGALAKGYFADRIVSDLVKEGATSALINLGGNVLVAGPNPSHSSKAWFIGIQDPKNPRGQHLGTLRIDRGSVVTSGIYERYFEVNGRAYHHILDKTNGYPVQSDLASLTILAESSLEAESWTSKLFAMPCQDIIQIIDQVPGIEAIVITKEQKILLSQGMKGKFFPKMKFN